MYTWGDVHIFVNVRADTCMYMCMYMCVYMCMYMCMHIMCVWGGLSRGVGAQLHRRVLSFVQG